MTNHPYSQDVITRLHERAEGYRQSGPSAAHTADLLDEAAGAIGALIQLEDLATVNLSRTSAALTELRASCHVRDNANSESAQLVAADRYTEALINAKIAIIQAGGEL